MSGHVGEDVRRPFPGFVVRGSCESEEDEDDHIQKETKAWCAAVETDENFLPLCSWIRRKLMEGGKPRVTRCASGLVEGPYQMIHPRLKAGT